MFVQRKWFDDKYCLYVPICHRGILLSFGLKDHMILQVILLSWTATLKIPLQNSQCH